MLRANQDPAKPRRTLAVALTALVLAATATIGVSPLTQGTPICPVRVSSVYAPSPVCAACEDGWDNDGDKQIDYPGDSDCTSPSDNDETHVPQCRDGIDNDGDEWIDYPGDNGCDSSEDDMEECYWSSKTADVSIETYGSGWGTKVSYWIEWTYGCRGGPYFDIADGECTVPSGSGWAVGGSYLPCWPSNEDSTKYGWTGTFQCTSSSAPCAGKPTHTMGIRVRFYNNGNFECDPTPDPGSGLLPVFTTGCP